MLNEFWLTSSVAYRLIVLGAIGLLLVGLVLTIVGANVGNTTLMWTGMPFLGLGALLHVAGMAVRATEVRRQLRKTTKKS